MIRFAEDQTKPKKIEIETNTSDGQLFNVGSLSAEWAQHGKAVRGAPVGMEKDAVSQQLRENLGASGEVRGVGTACQPSVEWQALSWETGCGGH